MFIHTDLLRAALCCVADEKEERGYLRGVHITPTHIQATNGHACVSMEHGADNPIEGVFIINGTIPDEAEGTFIKPLYGTLVAEHVTEDNQVIGRSNLDLVLCRYPDFSKLLPATPEPSDLLPIFQAKYLALPQQMFGKDFIVAVMLKSWGHEKPCQLIFDKAVNQLYGNPFVVIMPMRPQTFERLEAAFDEESN
ncbi:hypothetical protein [Erwinia typographi]|uniref:hypothetical protein n=1 Tax=Erwinia typographi TaxID=371042 RepID=UPI00068C1D4B|nr:hypothetical protein [Erwinia typographi]